MRRLVLWVTMIALAGVVAGCDNAQRVEGVWTIDDGRSASPALTFSSSGTVLLEPWSIPDIGPQLSTEAPYRIFGDTVLLDREVDGHGIRFKLTEPGDSGHEGLTCEVKPGHFVEYVRLP